VLDEALKVKFNTRIPEFNLIVWSLKKVTLIEKPQIW